MRVVVSHANWVALAAPDAKIVDTSLVAGTAIPVGGVPGVAATADAIARGSVAEAVDAVDLAVAVAVAFYVAADGVDKGGFAERT